MRRERLVPSIFPSTLTALTCRPLCRRRSGSFAHYLLERGGASSASTASSGRRAIDDPTPCSWRCRALDKLNLQSGAELDDDLARRDFFEDELLECGGGVHAACGGRRGSREGPRGSWRGELFARVVWGRAGCVRWSEWCWAAVAGWDVGFWGGRVGSGSRANRPRTGAACAGCRGRRNRIVCSRARYVMSVSLWLCVWDGAWHVVVLAIVCRC